VALGKQAIPVVQGPVSVLDFVTKLTSELEIFEVKTRPESLGDSSDALLRRG